LRLGISFGGRGAVAAAAGVLAGTFLRLFAYPTVIHRMSPGGALEEWDKRKRPGDILGFLHVDASQVRSAGAIDGGGPTLPSAESAARWLGESTHARHFLAFAAGELPRLNAAYRAKHGTNVPVLSGASGGGAFLLAGSALGSGERNDNPLEAVVRSSPPEGLTAAAARVGDSLTVLGWRLRDEDGRTASAIPGRTTMHLEIAIAVDAEGTPPGGHCTFVHIDHLPTRFSSEHREHPYPMSLWRKGDVVIDDFTVQLPAHFHPASYPLYWGVGVLPCEDDRRLPVLSGPSDGHDRVALGRLEVR
jgi:hypothetical protein